MEFAVSKQSLDITSAVGELKACVVVESRVVKPSEACKSQYKDTLYTPLMRALCIDTPVLSKITKSTNEARGYPSYSFKWIVDGRMIPEVESYRGTIDYIEANLFVGQTIYKIGNGQGLTNRLLFNTLVHNRKPANLSTYALRQQGFSIPRVMFIIRGRSDLVKLREGETEFIPENVEFAIEIKPTYELDNRDLSESAGREASLQVIGLNAGNAQCSPAVVLTDLVKKHYVLYIERSGPLKHSLQVEQCSSLAAACLRASAIGLRKCVTADFSCAPTPGSSPKATTTEKEKESSAGDEEGEQEDEDNGSDEGDYENVAIEPVYKVGE